MQVERHLSTFTSILMAAWIGILCGTSGILKAQDWKPLAQRFNDEAPQQWRKYKSHTFNLRGRVIVTNKSQGIDRSSVKSEWKERLGRRLVNTELLDGAGHAKSRSVCALNNEYAFIIHRKEPDSPWVLSDLLMKPLEGEFQLPERYETQIGSSIQLVLTSVAGRDVAEIVRLPSFNLRGAAFDKRHGVELVRIDFECPHPVEQGPIQSGTILFDPQRSWCVREYEVQTKYIGATGVIRSQTIQIRESSKPPFPLPVRIAWTETLQRSKQGTVAQSGESTTVDYDLDESSPPSEEEFRLSAFDLPEPLGFKPIPPSRTWMWLLAATVGAAALAILFSWLKRRHASMATRSRTAS